MGNNQSNPAWFSYPFDDNVLGVPFGRDSPQLVVSIDIGATHSAVATALLQPGHPPVQFPISHWPGQEALLEDNKVPSVLQYSSSNYCKSPVAVGAEVITSQTAGTATLYRVRYFKLRLLEQQAQKKIELASLIPTMLEDLPPTVDLLKIYSDYMRYLIRHTQTHLIDTTGDDLWEKHGREAQIILTHPNLWDAEQHNFLREAAIAGGLISRERAQDNLHFVEEAEAASRYYVSKYAAAFGILKPGTRFMVCDAGGSTVDITTYDLLRRDKGIHLNQVMTSCVGAGGIYINAAFEEYISTKLRHLYDEKIFANIVAEATADFETQAKRTFQSPADNCSVRLRGRVWDEPRLGIKDGSLQLDGVTMNSFFEPSVTKIMREAQNLARNVDYIILTGGLGGSRLVKREFQDTLARRDCKVISPTAIEVVKPVAIGALVLAVGRSNTKKTGIFSRLLGRWLSG